MNRISKRERFEKVASARVQKTIDMLYLLQNCSNTNNYEYTEEDVQKMFDAIGHAYRDAKAAYTSAKNKEEKKSFSF